MRKSVNWLVILVVAFGAWAVATRVNQAQTAPGGSGTWVGVVDLVRVFNDFEQTKILNVRMEEYKAKLADQRQAREEEIDLEKQTLQGFAPDSAEYHKRAKALKKMMIDYQAWLTVEREYLADEHRIWIEKTYQTVTECIAKVARAKGIQVVITREEIQGNVQETEVLLKQILNRKVVYWDSSVDLTDEVLLVLNDEFAREGRASAITFGQ